jgi:hypothetical protein
MKNKVISIFGEIEEIVAKQMMAEGKGVGLLAPTLSVSLNDIPVSCKFNHLGDPVRIVIVMPRSLLVEFERRIEDLRI